MGIAGQLTFVVVTAFAHTPPPLAVVASRVTASPESVRLGTSRHHS